MHFKLRNQLIIEGYVMSYWKEMAESKLSPFYRIIITNLVDVAMGIESSI